MRTRAPLGGCCELVSIRDRVRLAQRGSVSGLDALPPGAWRSQRRAARLQALPRVANALPRHTAQRQDASPLSQRARARSLRYGRRRAVSACTLATMTPPDHPYAAVFVLAVSEP